MRTTLILSSLALMSLVSVGCGRRNRYAPVYTGQTYYTSGASATVQAGYVQQPTYVQQQPTYVQQQPTYVQQQPTYVQQQPTYVQQQPTYVQQQPNYTQQPVLDTTVYGQPYGTPVVLQAQPTVYYYQPTGVYRRPALWGGATIYVSP